MIRRMEWLQPYHVREFVAVMEAARHADPAHPLVRKVLQRKRQVRPDAEVLPACRPGTR